MMFKFLNMSGLYMDTPPCEQTDTTENITFATPFAGDNESQQISFWMVLGKFIVLFILSGGNDQREFSLSLSLSVNAS